MVNQKAKGEATQNGETVSDKVPEPEDDEKCGIGPCKPSGLQCCSKLIFFTVFLALAGMVTIMEGPLLVSQVTSIERHFEMNSTQIGALMSANDIGFMVLVLLVSHFAKNAHAPRLLSVSSMTFALAAICIALLNFAHPRSLADEIQSEPDMNQTKSQSQSRNKYICVPDMRNRTFDEGCNSGNAPMGNVPLVVVFGLFLALQGVAKAMRSPLGVTYIDNNVTHPSHSGFHIGLLMTMLLFGPPIGFAFGGFISQIPVDLSETSMSSRDPRWVGAWWVGFLVCGVLVFMSAVPMLFVPRRMPKRCPSNSKYIDNNAAEDEKAADSKKENVYPSLHQSENGEAKKNSDEKEKNGTMTEHDKELLEDEKKFNLCDVLRELPRSMLRLVKNPVYVILVLALGVHIFAVVGFSTFLIKFVQRQFGLPPHLSSYIFGLANLVFSGFGTFIGGVLVSRGNLTRRGCLRWVMFAGSVSVALSAVTLALGCDFEPVAGLGYSDPFTIDDGLSTCECDVKQVLPVCGGNTTFLSPCHAGCTRAVNTTHFADCSLAEEGQTVVGSCDSGCYLLIPFIVVQVLSSAFSSTTVTPVYISILRSMSEQDKTLGLGLLSFTMSLVGFIPGPIVYGAVIDRTCLVWTQSCGKSGACALYDVTQLRHNYIGVEVGMKALALLMFAVALFVLMWQIRTDRAKDEKQVLEDKDGKGKKGNSFQMMRF